MQCFDIDGFREVRVEPRLVSSLSAIGTAVTRQCDESSGTQQRVGAESAGNGVAVHRAGQPNVAQHQVGAERVGRLQRGWSVVGRRYLMTIQLEQHTHALGAIEVVFND